MDQRGHGRGIRGRERFSIDSCADDAAALIELLGEGSAVVVGYSMGGQVAQALALRHPHLVKGIVLCATAARIPLNPGLQRPVRYAATAASVLMDALPHRASEAMALRLWSDRTGSNSGSGREPGWGDTERARNDPIALLKAGTALGRFDSSGRLAQITCPAAVLVTGSDMTVPVSHQLRLVEGIPQAKAFHLEGGHHVCEESPETFVPALVEACDYADGAGETGEQTAGHPLPSRFNMGGHLSGDRND